MGGGEGSSPLIFQMYRSILLIYSSNITKKPQNYSQKASEALSGGQKFQIFLGEHAPSPPRGLMVIIPEA